MRQVAMSRVRHDLSRFLRVAQAQQVLITRRGKVAGVLIGFKDEDDWLDYRLISTRRFAPRIGRVRKSIRAGKGVSLSGPW